MDWQMWAFSYLFMPGRPGSPGGDARHGHPHVVNVDGVIASNKGGWESAAMPWLTLTPACDDGANQ